jgi:hypothetical protein
MIKKEIYRTSGKGIYLTIALEEENNIVSAAWSGFLTIEQVKAGYENLLLVIKEVRSDKMLVNHSKVSGPWQSANEWFQSSWNHRAVEAGLTTMAVVMSNDMFTQLSLQGFLRTVKGFYDTALFNDESAARQWLIGQAARSKINT